LLSGTDNFTAILYLNVQYIAQIMSSLFIFLSYFIFFFQAEI